MTLPAVLVIIRRR